MARQAPKPPQGLRNQLSNSLRRESGSAVLLLLLVVTVTALLWANSPASARTSTSGIKAPDSNSARWRCT